MCQLYSSLHRPSVFVLIFLFCLQDSDESVEDEDTDMDGKVSSLLEEDEKNLADDGITLKSHNHTVYSKIIYEIIIIFFSCLYVKSVIGKYLLANQDGCAIYFDQNNATITLQVCFCIAITRIVKTKTV